MLLAGRLQPPAIRARRTALALSAVSVAFSIAFGFALRRWIFLDDEDFVSVWLTAALFMLLIALLLRMIAAICELLWLERTWTNLPEELRKVGPMENVSSAMLFGFAFVPVFAWFWKLGLVVGIADGFESVRASRPFRAPVPKKLGMAAVIIGWVPGLNVYLAPFLWEMFARRIDAVCIELGAGPG